MSDMDDIDAIREELCVIRAEADREVADREKLVNDFVNHIVKELCRGIDRTDTISVLMSGLAKSATTRNNLAMMFVIAATKIAEMSMGKQYSSRELREDIDQKFQDNNS